MVDTKKLAGFAIPLVTLAISICFFIIYLIMILSGPEIVHIVATQLGYSTDAISRGMVWTLLSSMLIHTSLQHLLFNVIFILIFGSLVEIKMGKKLTLVIIFLGGILGNIFHSFTNPPFILSVGSGWSAYSIAAVGLILLFNHLYQKAKNN